MQNVFLELKIVMETENLFCQPQGVEDAIQKVKDEIKNIDDSSSRSDELKKLCYSLQALRDRNVLNNNSKLLLSLPQILISDRAGNHKSDIDGFCLSFTG